VIKVAGPLFVEVTNTVTGKAVTVNASSSLMAQEIATDLW
jgi:hypothetical protein